MYVLDMKTHNKIPVPLLHPARNGNDRVRQKTQFKTMNRVKHFLIHAIHQCNKGLLITLLLLLPPALSEARKSDFSQAIDVQADSSEFDERRGIQILRGNVNITQGSMTIQADEITVELLHGKLGRITGKGSPIIFQQENEEGALVTGRCNELIYETQNARLVLIGKASLKQPNQELSGNRIEFDSKTQKVKADGGKSGRVTIRIQPPDELQNQ